MSVVEAEEKKIIKKCDKLIFCLPGRRCKEHDVFFDVMKVYKKSICELWKKSDHELKDVQTYI